MRRMRLRTWMIAGTFASFSVACAAVLGIEDITNDPPPGSGSDASPGEDRTEPADVTPGSDASTDAPIDVFDATLPPSCVGLEAGCGPAQHNCCSTFPIQGGTFNRSNDPAFPATVTSFKLDEFEVSVSRFRAFFDIYPASKPAAGAGAHPNVLGSGWDPAWDANLPAGQAQLAGSLACSAAATATATPGANENKPINCVSWFVAFAFCIWDGGFLPTEAEWNIAAAAGTEQRPYPWGTVEPDPNHATYGPAGPGFLGAKSTLGDSKYGHADMAGNMSEWMLDWAGTYPLPCSDCVQLDAAGSAGARARRGGDWDNQGTDASERLSTMYRIAIPPTEVRQDVGMRCARAK